MAKFLQFQPEASIIADILTTVLYSLFKVCFNYSTVVEMSAIKEFLLNFGLELKTL